MVFVVFYDDFVIQKQCSLGNQDVIAQKPVPGSFSACECVGMVVFANDIQLSRNLQYIE